VGTEEEIKKKGRHIDKNGKTCDDHIQINQWNSFRKKQ